MPWLCEVGRDRAQALRKEHGFSFRYVPASIVYHKGNKTGFGAYNSEYAALKGRNLRKFLKRHSSPFQWYCFHLLLPF